MAKCDICIAKYYCNESGLVNAYQCLSGHYCPANSTQPTPCPAVSNLDSN